VVVGEEEKNGGLWCSPEGEDVEPDLLGLPRDGDDRLDPLASLGVRPLVGSVVMSLTEKTPNCMSVSVG
jgi:hypothetical protein